MKHSLLLVAVVALVAVASPAYSQYMYLDVNGDGINTVAGDIITSGTTQIDVYLNTNHNFDGTTLTPATCAQGAELELTINSYEVIMRKSGTITFGDPSTGAWTDLMSYATNLGDAIAGTDVYMGRGSGVISPAGTYHLGHLAVSGIVGNPVVTIVSSTSASATAETAFGCACYGNDFDNTMKLGSDWFDTSGTYPPTPVTPTTWGAIKKLYR